MFWKKNIDTPVGLKLSTHPLYQTTPRDEIYQFVNPRPPPGFFSQMCFRYEVVEQICKPLLYMTGILLLEVPVQVEVSTKQDNRKWHPVTGQWNTEFFVLFCLRILRVDMLYYKQVPVVLHVCFLKKTMNKKHELQLTKLLWFNQNPSFLYNYNTYAQHHFT